MRTLHPNAVIASEAKQSSFRSRRQKLDCFVAYAPRNGGCDQFTCLSLPAGPASRQFTGAITTLAFMAPSSSSK
jgi:hypothetical protein